MRRHVHDTLDAQFDEHNIVRQLHDVPPHEVYEVRVGGRRAVCKRDTGPTGSGGIEGRVAAFVGTETTVPVPEVLAVGDDHYVAAWHPSAPEPNAGSDPDEAWARAAGRGLATLHAATADHLDGYGAFRPVEDGLATPDTNDWHAAAVAYVERRRPVLAEYGHADVADAVLDYLREHPDVFSCAGDPVCCHGWWTPEHVAVRDDTEQDAASRDGAAQVGTVACALDFEHALAAPGEWDVWRTFMPAFDGGDDHTRQVFLDGYQSVRSLPDGFEARRPLYALLNGVYYVESLYVQNQHGARETEKRASWLRESVFETLDELP